MSRQQMMINYPHIAAMVFNTPLYATPEVVASVKAVLIPRLTGRQLPDTHLDVDSSQPINGQAMQLSDEEREVQNMCIVGKVAVIRVHGVLVARRGTIDSACTELISYERLRTQISAALKHELVEEIVLDFIPAAVWRWVAWSLLISFMPAPVLSLLLPSSTLLLIRQATIWLRLVPASSVAQQVGSVLLV